MSDFRLGIVRLGKAAGKTKYALIDERDICLVEHYAFEARLEVDHDGNGAAICAFIYDVDDGRPSAQHLHDFIWERHYGGIAPGCQVVHRNKVTMDNRIENLVLIRHGESHVELGEETSCKTSREQSLYWYAVKQLHVDPEEEQYQNVTTQKYYNCNGEILDSEEASTYYECHYPPCTSMESEILQFSICGQCHKVRYCGAACQQNDWPVHKQFCRETRHHYVHDRPPDR